ncbi:MAG: chloride channel protein [Acidobacteria bacterium]|nr:MAG: chloride channel protein [Acidobacteriota bacterium]
MKSGLTQATGAVRRFLGTRANERLMLMVVGFAVGVCSGLAAVALNRSIITLTHWLEPLRGTWWAFVLPGCGATLSALFLEKLMREGAGHGVPEVIYSVTRRGGLLRLRTSFSRLVSSLLTIGSGGSAGPEAPIVASGASIGSNIGRFLGFNDRRRITLVGCGAAGAIAAVFNAPIAGIVFTVEVILDEWTAINIVPIAIAAVAGTEVSRLLQGNQIPFAHTAFSITMPDLIAAAGLAIACAAVSVGLSRLVRASHGFWAKVPAGIWWRAFLGGCVVGGIGTLVPSALGEGYDAVKEGIEGRFATGLLLVSVILVAKIVATATTLGSGGSGGIFAPALAVGSLLGLAFHRALITVWPSVGWVGEGCFALLGMAGLISGILQAPLTGLFLVIEITGGYEVILPLIIVSMVSSTLCHALEPASFYLKDLMAGGPLVRPGSDARILADLKVTELLERDCLVVPETMRLGELVEIVKKSHRNHFPVVEPGSDRLAGMVHLDDVRGYLFDTGLRNAVVVAEIMTANPAIVSPDTGLIEILALMDRTRSFSLPVVDNGRFLGMVSKGTVLDQYRKELIVQSSK